MTQSEKRKELLQILTNLKGEGYKLYSSGLTGDRLSVSTSLRNGECKTYMSINRTPSLFCCGLTEIGNWGTLSYKESPQFVEVLGKVVPYIVGISSQTITTLSPSQKWIFDILVGKCRWASLAHFYNANSGNMVDLLGYSREKFISPIIYKTTSDGRADKDPNIFIQDRSLFDFGN